MSYCAPVKDMLFVMKELAGIDAVAQLPGYEDAGVDTAAAVLEDIHPRDGLRSTAAYRRSATARVLRRMVEGTAPHAVRRLHEMEAAAEPLTDLGIDPVMTRSTVESLRRVPTDGLPKLP